MFVPSVPAKYPRNEDAESRKDPKSLPTVLPGVNSKAGKAVERERACGGDSMGVVRETFAEQCHLTDA